MEPPEQKTMMMEFTATYPTPCAIIAAAALIGALCLNSLLSKIGGNRSVFGRSLRWALVVTVAAAFTLPVAVPRTEDVFAPAFLVLLFETVFQSQGAPEEARRVMISVLPMIFGGALAICLLGHLPFRKKRPSTSGVPPKAKGGTPV